MCPSAMTSKNMNYELIKLIICLCGSNEYEPKTELEIVVRDNSLRNWKIIDIPNSRLLFSMNFLA